MDEPLAKINVAALTFYADSETEGPKCLCSFCHQPIGAAEDDPRWDAHDRDCVGCEVCEIALRLWSVNDGCATAVEARLHLACFNLLLAEQQLNQ